MNKDWKVYFVQAGSKNNSPVKIGYTQDIDRRLAEIQVHNPYPVSLLFTLPCESLDQAKKLERFLHRQLYKHNHLHGEWFLLGNISIPKLLDKFNTSHKHLNYDTEVSKQSAKSSGLSINSLKKENEKLKKRILHLENLLNKLK